MRDGNERFMNWQAGKGSVFPLSVLLLKVSLHFRGAKSLSERETQTVLSRAPATCIQQYEKLMAV